jgi:hypothetical protein
VSLRFIVGTPASHAATFTPNAARVEREPFEGQATRWNVSSALSPRCHASDARREGKAPVWSCLHLPWSLMAQDAMRTCLALTARSHLEQGSSVASERRVRQSVSCAGNAGRASGLAVATHIVSPRHHSFHFHPPGNS